MLKKLFLSAVTLMTASVWAKPQMAWVPEASDVVLVGHAFQEENVAVTKAWEKAFKQLGIEFSTTDESVLAVMRKECPEVLELYKALGFSDDLKSHTVDAMTVALLLPPEGKGEVVAVVTIGFTKALDEVALKKSYKDILNTTTSARVVEENEEWTFVEINDQMDDIKVLLASKVDGNVIQLIAGDDVARVRQMTKEAFKPIDASSVFAKAFVAPNAHTSSVIVAKDFASLIKKCNSEVYQEMQAFVPSFATLGEVVVKTMTEGVCYVIDVVMNNDTDAHARECYELMIGWRMMVRTFASQFLPTSTTAVSEINGIKIDHKGKQTSLRLKLDPVRISTIGEEIMKAQAMQMQDQYRVIEPTPSVDDVLDDDDVLIDDEILIDIDDEDMREILDAVDE